jgi:hypothetical protein
MTNRLWAAVSGVLLLASIVHANPREELRRAAAESDVARRAEAVLPILDADNGIVYLEVLDVWVGCGKAALPVLRSLIADETRSDRSNLVDTLVRAGGEDAVAELERMLGEERTFWDNLGLNLDEESKIPHARVQYLVDVLGHLRELGYRDSKSWVRAVRDRFDDQPILRDYGKARQGDRCVGSSPVVEAAQAILSRP